MEAGWKPTAPVGGGSRPALFVVWGFAAIALALSVSTSGCRGTARVDKSPREALSPTALAPQTVSSATEPTLPSLATLESRVRSSPNDPAALVALARARRDNKPAEAAKLLRRAVRLRPDFVDGYRGLAELYDSDTYADRQTETLETLVRYAPNDVNAVARLSQLYMRVHDIPRADSILRRALDAQPFDPTLIEARIAFCYSARHFPEGEALLAKRVNASPKDDQLLNRLSEMQRAQGKYDDAEKSIRKALDLNPDQPLHYRQLSHILITSEKPQRLAEAESAAQKAADALPGDEEALYWLAQAFDKQHKDSDAIRYYERVERLDVQYDRTAFRLGRLYLAAGRLADGERLLKLYNEMETNRSRMAQAVGLLRNHPERAQNHLELARVYRLAGDEGTAIALLRRATKQFPSERSIRILLAEALYAAGRKTEAKALNPPRSLALRKNP